MPYIALRPTPLTRPRGEALPARAQQRGRLHEARAIRPPIRKALAFSLLVTNPVDTNGARYHDAPR